MDDNVQILDWDSQFFGVPIGRVRVRPEPDNFDPATVRKSLIWADGRGIRCLYCLCECDHIEATEMLEQLGFRLVDIRLTLETKIDISNVEPVVTDEVLIRPARSSDLPPLEGIARTSHTDSRFFVDRHFPRERCGALYWEWLQKDARNPTGTLFVAELGGAPVGYLSLHLANADTATIGLLGVAEQARGRGIGKRLIAAAIRQASGQGSKQMEVVTQGRNRSAQRLYQGAGFRTTATQIWFHRWAEHPTPLSAPAERHS